MQKIDVYFVIQDLQDGTMSVKWFLTLEMAIWFQEEIEDGYYMEYPEKVETYIGSNVYLDAIKTSDHYMEEFEEFYKSDTE